MKTKSYTLAKDETLLVKGPAAVLTKSRGFSVLGVPMMPEEKIVIRRNKILPFDAHESESSAQVTMGEKGESLVSSDRVGVKIWEDVQKRVFANVELGKKRIMILGETDSGKSTLTSYLINLALIRDLRTILVDGDIGQGDLAPPGCIGAVIVRNKIYDLRDVRADIFSFLGFTSPRYVRGLIIERMKKTVSQIEEKEYDLCIINTDGYVADEGMDYKIDMVLRLKPDLIVCFRDIDKELSKRLESIDSAPTIISADKPEGVFKSPSERSERRLSQYLRFLKGGRNRSVDPNRVKLSFMGYLYEHNLSYEESKDLSYRLKSKAVFAKKGDNRLIMFEYGLENRIEMVGRFLVFGASDLRGMFIGLGSDDDVFSFAHITELHHNQMITLSTPFEGSFDTLFLSNIRISLNLRTEVILPIFRKD
ncbi:MAG: Clp1/GlmU family protein [Nitrososphaerales archaeon]